MCQYPFQHFIETPTNIMSQLAELNLDEIDTVINSLKTSQSLKAFAAIDKIYNVTTGGL